MPAGSKVSTITACYKKGNYLKTFLDELPNQTYFSDLEIVFDHNEPTNEELELLDNFRKNYPGHIHHIITTPVKLLGESWNQCLHVSSGEYLTIWNIDDLRTPKSIEIQAQFLDNNPAIDIVAGNFYAVPAFPSTFGKLIDLTKYPPDALKKCMKLGPFFMFRKKICEKTGCFDEQFRCANDFDFAMRLLHNGKARILNDNLGYFLDEGTGASTRKGSLCPVETTVIQLRYGIYDRIDIRYLPAALKYNIYNIKNGDDWIPVSTYIPDYDAMMKSQFKKIFTRHFLTEFGKYVNRKLRNLIIKSE